MQLGKVFILYLHIEIYQDVFAKISILGIKCKLSRSIVGILIAKSIAEGRGSQLFHFCDFLKKSSSPKYHKEMGKI